MQDVALNVMATSMIFMLIRQMVNKLQFQGIPKLRRVFANSSESNWVYEIKLSYVAIFDPCTANTPERPSTSPQTSSCFGSAVVSMSAT